MQIYPEEILIFSLLIVISCKNIILILHVYRYAKLKYRFSPNICPEIITRNNLK